MLHHICVFFFLTHLPSKSTYGRLWHPSGHKIPDAHCQISRVSHFSIWTCTQILMSTHYIIGSTLPELYWSGIINASTAGDWAQTTAFVANMITTTSPNVCWLVNTNMWLAQYSQCLKHLFMFCYCHGKQTLCHHCSFAASCKA